MTTEEIYRALKEIVRPIHAHDDQLLAIAHWINDEFETKIKGLKPGYVKIEGCDKAAGFSLICKESQLHDTAKKLYASHPGEDGYYNFTKFLWVKFADSERGECRLDGIVPYD